MKNEITKTIKELLDSGTVPLSLVKDKVNYRRVIVVKLSLKGHKQKEIAQKIGCSISTVEKDFCFLREKGGD